jgi:hypothetical protein
MEPENIIIDPELWLQVLLAQLADEDEKQKLIAGMSTGTGIAPEKVEEILHTLAEVLIDIGRSN